MGQTRLLLAREPLDDARVATLAPNEQDGLAALRRALAHGESLGLARTTSYRDLVDGREHGVHVVTAAPANRVVARTWWFPITGSVSYRGYFDRARARAFADELEADGYDTYVRPAALYSTLGWFDDPLPRALLAWPEERLVETILHELVHETLFVANDVAYNEALAVFVAHRATLAFYAGQPERIAAVEADFADELAFAELVEALRVELERVYADAPDASGARRLRAPVFERYQREVFAATPWRSRRYARFPEETLSNAWLAAHRDYVGDLPCFERELAGLGGELRAFLRAHLEAPGRRDPACAPSDAAE